MSICERTGLACCCQPDENYPCPALGDGLKNMMLEWRSEAIRLQGILASERAEGPADERAAFYAWIMKFWPIGWYDRLPVAWEAWLARSRLAAATPVVPPSETAWLIEIKPWGHTPQWWGFNFEPSRHADWCADANNAIRFARKEDGERMRTHILAVSGLSGHTNYANSITVTEHMWPALAASPSPRTPEQPEQPEQPTLLWQHFDHSKPTGERMFWSYHSDRAKALADPDKSFNETCDTQPAEQPSVHPVVPSIPRPAAATDASADARDAERYRWLVNVVIKRGGPHQVRGEPCWFVDEFVGPIAYGSTIGAAIDAAMTQEKQA